MPFISTVTGSFTAGRRASAFGSAPAWSPTDLGLNLRMWINPSDTSTTTFASGSNALLSITDASGATTAGQPHYININSTPQQSTEDNKQIIVFDHATNEYLYTSSIGIASSGNHWALFAGEIASVDNSKDSIWSFETAESPKRDYAISAGSSSQFDGELDLDGLSTKRISSNAGNLIEFTSGTPIQPNTKFMIVCYFDKTGSEIGVRINGSNAFTPETDYDNNLKTTAQMNIFRNRGSQTYGGKLFEFIAAQGQPGTGGGDKTYIEQAEGYIAQKWGLTDLLPSDHPYKNGGGGGLAWGGDRAIVWGSNGGNWDGEKIDYFDIATPGNASLFGDVHRQVDGWGPGKYGGTCVSDTTYGVYAGGQSAHNLNPTDQIDYITISTLGNSADFGSLTTKQMKRPAGGSDGTTGYIAGGQDDWTGANYYTGCDTFTIATPGNATLSTFTLSTGANQTTGTNDTTRMLISGGYFNNIANDNTIQYLTFASAGTSQDFGDLTVGRGMAAATSDNTYALIGGGQDRIISSTQVQSIDVVTIQTTGNATNFGNLVTARRGLSAVSNGTYACFCAGVGNMVDIDQLTIATPGNATDFGDLVSGGESPGCCSGSAS